MAASIVPKHIFDLLETLIDSCECPISLNKYNTAKVIDSDQSLPMIGYDVSCSRCSGHLPTKMSVLLQFPEKNRIV